MFNNATTTKTARPPQGTPPPSSWYDEDYYGGKSKSNWKCEYNWINFGKLFRDWWKFLFEGFPESKSFLDVGCARGICERAFIEVCNGNGFVDKTIEGFDHSEYAIATAEEKAKPFVKRAALHEYVFERAFDVMISLDVFEHIPLNQVEDFLRRSRPHIKDCIFAVIALDEPRQWGEQSHINLRTRAEWHETFIKCGWRQDDAVVKVQRGGIFRILRKFISMKSIFGRIWNAIAYKKIIVNEFATMQRLAMASPFAKTAKVEIFIYGANHV